MPILPRLIDILLKLYNDIPDDVYDEEQVRKNVFSSLRSIFTLFKKIASDKKRITLYFARTLKFLRAPKTH